LIKFFLGLILAIVIWIVWTFDAGIAVLEEFDSKKWKSLSEVSQVTDPDCYRGGMALSIIESDLLIGKDRVDVITILGTPSDSISNRIRYDVGMCSHLGWKHSRMKVHFDQNDKVTSVVLEESH